ncbi:adipose-secreted signaling protein-like [Tachypleus tridentatus]|uniref:adipose-secreted signaling protein-like n=1 Tax=Tachypleus tridentatus TaxID=6853 RepID=UPI003FD1834F
MEIEDFHQHEGDHQRVHFNEASDTFGHDADIIVHRVNDSHINIHVGFLQIYHKYEISFVFDSRETAGPLAVSNQNPSNLNLRVTKLYPVNGKHDNSEKPYEITLEFFAYKEKLIREQIVLEACDSSRCTITLLIHAQVLGKGKGTPFLKNGVHCIGYELVKEGSEHSD